MRNLDQLRDKKKQLHKDLKVSQKEIGLDFSSLKWNILMDLGLDFVSMFLSGKKKDQKPAEKEES